MFQTTNQQLYIMEFLQVYGLYMGYVWFGGWLIWQEFNFERVM